ncbi:hypothetical protein GpartN1_g6775.t1 [Galdieria partita]|uniref:NADPH-dependent FMN reductase-like domain-containing protein n=1 Tax=Galdieria partita TaxID=83374 RepID=A0A9C7Q279_9RHOD|nr:hypothetical protein GpartN1_g5946.t1 [Galdieria partita]GJQ14232.1 hypothetical protein GpartN1_g6023.t1 [Galdieria partita]GJQ14984.1 hypothetical protein GpartN1_g6775.t1 [Galdieria partita]
MDCQLTTDDQKLSEWKKFRLDSDKNDWIDQVDISGAKSLYEKEAQDRPLRVLVLYGSLRQRSFSRCCAYEAARLLDKLGADVRVFDPKELPVKGQVEETHHKVQELRELALWSEAQFWCSPEMHGNVTGCFKNQIDWIPLSLGSVRPTQGRTLAICQVNGGSQSFNAVNTLRILGRWMRMFTIPNQSSIPKAWQEFDECNRMKPSPLRDRLVDVVEELVKFSLLLRDNSSFLVDRYSERKEKGDFGRLLSQEEKEKLRKNDVLVSQTNESHQ